MPNRGVFTISLDFELYWGMMDILSEEAYSQNLKGTPKAIEEMLKLFTKYDIHTTWASVGFLFLKDDADLRKHLPLDKPKFEKSINLYHYIDKTQNLSQIGHFAPSLIQKIAKTPFQEIATHTFSHYYTLEEGQTLKQFREDLTLAQEVANRFNIKLKSIVFPRNQYADDYLNILKEFDITAYRGNEKSWMYKAVDFKEKTSLKQKIARMADSYLNISGHNTYTLEALTKQTPYNIPASRFLRPYTPKLALLEPLKLARIKQDMLYAAKNNQLYHLWWHPHNFGIYTKENLHMLEKILNYYQELNQKYGFQSQNMHEVATFLTAHP